MKKVTTEIVPNSVIATMKPAVTPRMVLAAASLVLWETNVRTSVTPGSMGQGVLWIAYATESTRRVATIRMDSVLAKVDIRYTKQTPLLERNKIWKFWQFCFLPEYADLKTAFKTFITFGVLRGRKQLRLYVTGIPRIVDNTLEISVVGWE